MPYFDRLHKRLQEKADHPEARSVLYVAIGDSVTQGCMEEGVLDHEQVYHELLRKRIYRQYPNSVLNVINSGVAGGTAAESRTRWDRDVLCYQPDLVTIKFGLNDAHAGAAGVEPYIDAIRDLVGLVKEKTEAEILLLTPSMMMKRDNERISAGQRHFVPTFLKLAQEGHLVRYVDALRAFAADQAIPLLDVYRMWEDMENDGVDIHGRLSNGINHPDRLFHAQLAKALENTLFAETPVSK